MAETGGLGEVRGGGESIRLPAYQLRVDGDREGPDQILIGQDLVARLQLVEALDHPDAFPLARVQLGRVLEAAQFRGESLPALLEEADRVALGGDRGGRRVARAGEERGERGFRGLGRRRSCRRPSRRSPWDRRAGRRGTGARASAPDFLW